MLPFLSAEPAPAAPSAAQHPVGKVELDLDGAPFLEPEPEPPPPPPQTKSIEDVHEEGEKKPKSRKKLLILILLLILLGGGAAAAYLFLFKNLMPAPDPEVEVVVVPSTPPELPEAPVSLYNIDWPPFWVETLDPEGEIRFIYCKLGLSTNNMRIYAQLISKDLTLRDAVYYFLHHKSYGELANLRRLEHLKEEMLSIINYYIVPEQVMTRGPDGEIIPADPPQQERLNDLLLEDYLIK